MVSLVYKGLLSSVEQVIMAQKHRLEEVEVEEVEKVISSANVYGVVTSLSPVKKGRKSN